MAEAIQSKLDSLDISSDATSIPTKKILSKEHLTAFQSSQTYTDLVQFIENLNSSIIGHKLTEDVSHSPIIDQVLTLLNEIESLAKSIPPVDNSASRFGNPAFKTFYDRLEQNLPSYLETTIHLPPAHAKEITTYLQESWGNRTRIDYGSGMELNFVCFLLCLKKIGLVGEEESVPLVLHVFWRYIEIMRYLQSTYWLEPAGSHGVWGLDDYHFLPFLWGSGQLANHKYLRPKSIHDDEILDEFGKDYMYFACIRFINSIKTASLRWHSPMLDDISVVKTWSKVNEGMIKMYKAEVLGKLPVMQHFLFGTLLPSPDLSGMDGERVEEDEHGHVHGKAEKGWTMDCCGIPVPSAFAAAAAEKGETPSTGLLKPRSGLKPIPFD